MNDNRNANPKKTLGRAALGMALSAATAPSWAGQVGTHDTVDVVTHAVAAKRWTEEDRETFRSAFGHLTSDQLMELTNVLAPAINDGEITVEVTGPLF
ncbi:MAG: hypothetical protein ACT4QB_19785 [Gammaproteobacteria bacterium]